MQSSAEREHTRERQAIGRERAVVLILGMHRSGTSCLSGTLQQRGLHLGQVSERNLFNLKGNRESRRVTQLNDAVLAHNGGSWREVPTRLNWTHEHAAERDLILGELLDGTDGPAGLKDPRTLLTLAFWEQARERTRWVGIFRHPALVARSLERRNRMPAQEALALWEAYNQRLLQWHTNTPFPLLCFDSAESEYLGAVGQVAAHLGLAEAPAAVESAFFDPQLRSELDPAAHLGVPARLLDLYERLRSRSIGAH